MGKTTRKRRKKDDDESLDDEEIARRAKEAPSLGAAGTSVAGAGAGALGVGAAFALSAVAGARVDGRPMRFFKSGLEPLQRLGDPLVLPLVQGPANTATRSRQ